MSDVMRKMLDELMGTSRNGNPSNNGMDFTSSKVCRSYLLGLCPHDLFSNLGTFKGNRKMGVCSKIHDPALKADYEKSSLNYDYKIDQLDHVTDFVEECDQKVLRNKNRLSKAHSDQRYGPESETVNVLQALSDQINIALKKAEELGELGQVEESLSTMQYVDELKVDKRRAVENYRNNVTSSRNQQQKLRVCEVCAAYLSLYDDDRRLADHFGGKLHMGFVKLRKIQLELRKNVSKNRDDAIKTNREVRNCCGINIDLTNDPEHVNQYSVGSGDDYERCKMVDKNSAKGPIRYRSRSRDSSSSDEGYSKYRKRDSSDVDECFPYTNRHNSSEHSNCECSSYHQKIKSKRKKRRRKNRSK